MALVSLFGSTIAFLFSLWIVSALGNMMPSPTVENILSIVTVVLFTLYNFAAGFSIFWMFFPDRAIWVLDNAHLWFIRKFRSPEQE